jgi:(1->4)-alpha-D-glucan 1-alpha-D-glucosylmutase
MLYGAYTPLDAEGTRSDHIVAFARHDDSGTVVAVVPRLVRPLVADDRPLPIGPETWGSSRILLPPAVRATGYRHVMTGEWCDAAGSDHSSLPIAMVLRTCPVAWLWAPAVEAMGRADAA